MLTQSVSLFLIVTGITGLCTSPAGAWGRDGHRAVCSIAWDGLDEGIRNQIKGLLDIETREQFSDECNWADEIRRERRNTASWHFLDSPPGKTINMKRDCPDQKCIVAQIERTTSVLSSHAPKSEKAEALKFLAHFVGDLHQPLHIAFVGNQGGNSIKVRFRGKLNNLHSVWDSGLLETGAKADEDTVVAILRDAAAVKGPDRRSSKNPLVWAKETRKITAAPATGYVDSPAEMDLSDDYVRQNYPVAIQQIKKAGVRLGRLLSSVMTQQ